MQQVTCLQHWQVIRCATQKLCRLKIGIGGSGHPLAPPTPPYRRVRIRRFSKLSPSNAFNISDTRSHSNPASQSDPNFQGRLGRDLHPQAVENARRTKSQPGGDARLIIRYKRSYCFLSSFLSPLSSALSSLLFSSFFVLS